MRLTVLLHLIVLLTLESFGQTRYFNHKYYIDASLFGRTPVLSNLYNEGYFLKEIDGKLKRKGNFFEWGQRFGASYSYKANKAIGFEFSQEHTLFQPESNSSILGSNYINIEAIHMRTNIFSPRFEYTSSNGILPIGINHQLGFGFAFTKAIDDNNLVQTEYNTTNLEAPNLFKSVKEPIKGYQLFYGLNFRFPISKNIIWNITTRYTINITSRKTSQFPSINNYPDTISELQIDPIEMLREYRTRKSYMLINLGTGIIISL